MVVAPRPEILGNEMRAWTRSPRLHRSSLGGLQHLSRHQDHAMQPGDLDEYGRYRQGHNRGIGRLELCFSPAARTATSGRGRRHSAVQRSVGTRAG